jgi:tripartite-type tricarboxylate transporter receptor subunit TctC
MSRVASAQAYPSRPVRIIVGQPAGGVNDILARLVGQWLSERLGQPFIVENRPGAAGNIGAEVVVRAPADGYTLLLAGSQSMVNTWLYKNLNFNFIRDIAPVASFVREPNVMLVNPSVPVKTVPEFISYAKDNPGKINMASAGNGTQSHVFGELFKMITGTNMIHVPYRGGVPALIDLLSGQVQLYFGATTSSIQYIRSGRLRALGVTAAERSEALSDIPAIGEFVAGYEASSVYGLGAPKNTPTGIVDRLNMEVNAGLADDKMKALLADLGCTVLAGSPADFGKLIANETEKWGKVVKFAGVKLG